MKLKKAAYLGSFFIYNLKSCVKDCARLRF